MSIDAKRRVSEEVVIISSVSSEESVTTQATPPVVKTEEDTSSTGGAFSQQKGGAAALALSAMLEAMDAQLVAVELKRHRAAVSIANQEKATSIQADNLTEMGRREGIGAIVAGVLGIAAGVLAVGLSAHFIGKSFASDKQMNPLMAERQAFNDHIDALEGLKATPGGPARVVLATGAPPRTSAAVARLESGVLKGSDVKSTATIAGNNDLTKLLQKLPEDNVDALRHAASDPDLAESMLKKFTDKRNELDAQIRMQDNALNNSHHRANMSTQAANGLSQGVSGAVDGFYVKSAVRELEADNTRKQLTANYAKDDVELQSGTAGAREQDFRSTLRLLSEMTRADVRA